MILTHTVSGRVYRLINVVYYQSPVYYHQYAIMQCIIIKYQSRAPSSKCSNLQEESLPKTLKIISFHRQIARNTSFLPSNHQLTGCNLSTQQSLYLLSKPIIQRGVNLQKETNTNRSLLLCIHTVFKIITELSPTQPARTQQEKIGFRVPWKGRSFKNVQRYQQPPKDFTSRRHGF